MSDVYTEYGERQKVLYLIGSLRNERIPVLANKLRQELPDVEVFDDWYAAGPEADDYWKKYEQERGRTYEEALEGYAARNVFAFDRRNLDRATHVLLVLPAGKSGHMEVMYGKYGVGANAAILLEQDTDPRWDVMYQFVDRVIRNDGDIGEWINGNGKPESIATRGRQSSRRVSDGGWFAGLLPECIGRSSPDQ